MNRAFRPPHRHPITGINVIYITVVSDLLIGHLFTSAKRDRGAVLGGGTASRGKPGSNEILLQPPEQPEATMNTTTAQRTPTRARFLAVVGAITLLLSALSPLPAQAAMKDAITGVVVNPDEPGTPINQWDQFEVKATWAAPADAVAGDTFELAFPGFTDGVEESFALKDKQGRTVGDCEVQKERMVCTWTAYVESHDNVAGTLFFKAQAQSVASSTDWVWALTGGTTITTPGAGPVGPASFGPLEHSEKWSWQRTDTGAIRWALMLRGEDLLTPGGKPMTLTDTFDARLSMTAEGIGVDSTTPERYAKDKWDVVSPDDYTVDYAVHGFTWALRSVNPTLIYRVYYDTPTPAGTQTGDTFVNDVQANGTDFLTDTYIAQNAGGDGDGDQKLGEISWSKVDGRAAALAGSVWELTSADGTTMSVTDNGANDADPAEGLLRVSGLAWGTYKLTETRAPVGYDLDFTPREVTIDATHRKVSAGSIVNERSTGMLGWNKVDADGVALAGSEWLVTGPDGTQAVVVDNGENDKDPEPGALSITGLAWGEYTIHETKAPAGYEMSTATLTTMVSARSLTGSFGDIVNVPSAPGSTSSLPETTPGLPETTPSSPGSTPSTPEITPVLVESEPATSPTPAPSEIASLTRRTAPGAPAAIASAVPTDEGPPLASTGAATTGLLLVAGLLAVLGLTLFGLSKRRGRGRHRH